MVNIYFEIIKLNFDFIIGTLIILGILSIAITIWHKIEIKEVFERKKSQIFYYKNSKITWSTFVIGFVIIGLGKYIDSQIKIIVFLIGIYLILSQIIEYIAGKYFNTNILAITEDSLVDLNGRINKVKYKNVKAYERKPDSLVIRENYETIKYKMNDFRISSSLIEKIDEKLNTN